MNSYNNFRTLFGISLVILIVSCINAFGQVTVKDFEKKQYKTFGTMGKAIYELDGGEEATLFEHDGKGCLTHMWFGGNWRNYDELIIRVYVDGEEKAGIEMGLFLGHGIGNKNDDAPWGTSRIGKTGSPSGIYNNYRIPFGKHVKMTAQLPGSGKGKHRFWFIVRGSENVPVEFAGVTLPDAARLRLYKLENYTAEPLEEFDICNTQKTGMLYKVTVAGKSETLTYLECIVRAYVGGSDEPLLLASGLEDYFLGTYYFNKGKYYTDVAGLTHINAEAGSFSAYRFHEDDHVFYNEGLRLTLRCGEQTERQTWKAKPTKYTAYIWVYEW